MGDPTANIIRSLRFANYSRYDILSRDPTDETWIPRVPIFVEGDVTFIDEDDVDLVVDAFVYMFQDTASYRKQAPGRTAGVTSDFILVAVVQVDANGDYFVAVVDDPRVAASQNLSPNFLPLGGKSLSLPGATGSADQENPKEDTVDGVVFFLVSHTLLPFTTIQKLEQKRPPQLPLVKPFDNEHFAIISTDLTTPPVVNWVAFVVDPIKIAENFTKAYFTRADAFLALTQPYAAVEGVEEDKAALERQRKARVRCATKTVADTVKGMLVHAAQDSSLTSKIQAAINQDVLDSFLDDFNDDLKVASEAREASAIDLIMWIRSQLWRDIDESYRGGVPDADVNADYPRFLKALTDSFARLTESDPGVSYMMELLSAIDVDGVPDRTIPNVYPLSEFILRGDGAISDAAKQASAVVACGAGFVGAWGGFVNLVHAINMERLRAGGVEGTFGGIRSIADIPSPLDSSLLGRSTFRMAQTLNAAYGVKVIDILSPTLVVDFVATSEVGSVVVQRVETLDIHYGIVDGGTAAHEGVAGKVTHASLAKVLSILNVGLATYSLQEGLAKAQTFRDNAFTIIDFSQAVLDAAGNQQAFVAFWQRLNGKVDIFGQPLLTSKVLAGYFGFFGAMFSLASATNKTIKDYEERDFDAALGNGIQGMGALATAVGSMFVINAGFTGPAAGWFLFAGAVLSLGGYIFTAFADDDDLDILLKFSAFGTEAGAAVTAPAWAITPNQTFKDWDPTTEVGLLLQLEAFQNVFFAFLVSGVSGAPDTIRIFPSGLRKDSKFDLTITARYDSVLPRTVPADDPRRVGIQRGTRIQVDPDKLTMTVTFGAALVAQNNVTRTQVGGRDVLDIRIEPANDSDDADDVIANPRLKQLDVNVTLDVYGDGGSRFIPSNNKTGAPLAVAMEVFRFGQRTQPTPQTSTDFHA